jgi:PAS domain S-box-containing protein
MRLARFLPRKFSSRLFLMTFIAGLIPVIIFSILINIYGHRIQKEITKIIEQAYEQEMFRSEVMLREMGEAAIYSRAMEMAQQLEMVIESVPWMTLADLRRDSRFREVAVQTIGQTGYTFLFESDTGIIRFHRDRRLENKNVKSVFRDLPELQAIIAMSMHGPNPANGYYQLKAGDGHIMKRFTYIIPLHQTTADGRRLMVAATINTEEFSARIKESQIIHDSTKRYLIVASNIALQSFRHSGFLFMGLGIVTISILAFVLGIYFSRSVTRLREATARINQGDFSTPVPVAGTGEVATLVEDFNKMVDQLATTTVSKQLLQASEARLKTANADLRKEITVRERAEHALAAEKERLNITLRSIGDGVITGDAGGKILLINNAAEKLTGWRQDAAVGLDLDDVYRTVAENAPEPAEAEAEGRQNAPAEARHPLNEKVLKTKEGAEKIIAETSAPIRDQDGAILGTVIVFRDITGQKKMEDELLKARKLESVGVLAGGIAHDFNNLLAVILGNISFAKMFMKANDKTAERLVEAEKACLRGKDLTYQLLTFARGGEPLRKVMGIGPLIETTVRTCLAGSETDTALSLPESLLPVKIDEGQIRQVIQRIVDNASEAMEGRGTVTITGTNVAIAPDSTLTLNSGGYVRISIQDQGPGIAQEDLAKIFDPYFTRKQMGYQKGTGLGLSICYSIVKDHGGLITVESEVGKGTIFHIYLPAVIEDAPAPAVAEEAAAQGKGRLLLMDDEEAVGDVIVQILTHLGYEVQFARDGQEAIEYYEAARGDGRPFDVVIADLTVPDGMGGKEMMERLKAIDPDVKAIISSGYSNDPVLDNFSEYGFLGVAAKPYKIEQLCAILDTVIEGPPADGA